MALNENTIIKEISLNGISAKSVHARNTIVIELEGPNVHQITQEIMSKIVQLKVGIARDEIRALYNLGNHSIWYLSMTRHAAIKFHELLHNMSFKARDHNVVVTLKHLDRSKTKALLDWVPPTFTATDVKMVVQSISNPQTAIEIKKLKESKWEIYFHPEDIRNIPHYINVNFSTHSHLTLQLRIPGRDTPCFFCSSYQHEPCMCPLALEDDESHTCASKSKLPGSVNLRRYTDSTNGQEQGQVFEKVSAFFSLCDPYTADSSGSEVELFSQLRLSPKNENPKRNFEYMRENKMDGKGSENLEAGASGGEGATEELTNTRVSGVMRYQGSLESGLYAGSSESTRYTAAWAEKAAKATAEARAADKRAPRVPPRPENVTATGGARPKIYPKPKPKPKTSDLGQADTLLIPGAFAPSYARSSKRDAAKYKHLEAGKSPSSNSSFLSSRSPTPSDKSLNLYPEKRFVSTSSMNSQKEVSVMKIIKDYFSGKNPNKRSK